ncbi:uncharacterized protein [Ptychodera flava]|uniref:uncharacterized protein n=1 Tax=Ptychodera flava TaxID=63121 RepID=UPI00396A056B
MRIVYDCSARANVRSPSLNDCLETGPPLQPLLFDIITRNRMRKFCITGDVQKAFLQIRVHEQDRDALRVLWYNNLQDRGGNKEDDVATFKAESTKILLVGGFNLHKWHSNIDHLNAENDKKEEETYTTRFLGNTSGNETKILGIPWNKEEDTLTISFESCQKSSEQITKRKMLADINSIFDILGWNSPVTITAKLIFSEVCLLQLCWDEEIPDEIHRKWQMWINSLQRTPTITVPRCVFTDNPTHYEMHGFADASKTAVCAAIYIVAYENSTLVSQNLLTAKARIAPKHMSIPRLELIAAHTLAKLQNNVNRALSNFRITACHSWVDSTTILYWLSNHGEWSTSVRNRVKKICELTESKWRYVPTAENPSDLGTRGSAPSRLGTLWFQGPSWLSSEGDRPVQPEISESEGVKSEKKSTKKREEKRKEKKNSE